MNQLLNRLLRPRFWAGPLALLLLVSVGYQLAHRVQSHMSTAWVTRIVPWTEIYQGVYLTTRHLPQTPEGGGMVYAVRVDLKTPGVDLYFRPRQVHDNNPIDAFYVLRYPWQFADTAGLAVAVNSDYFSPLTTHRNMPSLLRGLNYYGDPAKQARPTVIEHDVRGAFHVAAWIYFDDDLTPHMERFARNRPRSDLTKARFAFTSNGQLVLDGKADPRDMKPASTTGLHARTILGIDSPNKYLYIVCFQRASNQLAAQQVLDLGIPNAMMLDGGGSTCLALGDHAKNYPAGTLLGGLRPVASILGIKANPLP